MLARPSCCSVLQPPGRPATLMACLSPSSRPSTRRVPPGTPAPWPPPRWPFLPGSASVCIPDDCQPCYTRPTSPPRLHQRGAGWRRRWPAAGRSAETPCGPGFARESEQLASELDDPQLLADALDARLLTSWGPDDLTERVSLAARLDAVAAHLTDVEQ